MKGILSTAGFNNIRIDTVEATMKTPDPVEKQVALYLIGGPAARLIVAKSPSAEVVESLTEALASELRNHEADGEISLGATVHYVAANR